jgi:6-phosphofructokinase 2
MECAVTLTPNPAIDISTAVEEVLPIRKLRCAAARRDPGGGGINVARVVRRFGGEVAAIYPAGGSTGKLLQQLVDREGARSIAINVAEETGRISQFWRKRAGSSIGSCCLGQSFRSRIGRPA